MEERERQGVTIDVCARCRGVFLDRGELEKLIALAEPAEMRPSVDVDDDRRPRRPNDDDDDDDRERPADGARGKQRRRGGFLDVIGDLFD